MDIALCLEETGDLSSVSLATFVMLYDRTRKFMLSARISCCSVARLLAVSLLTRGAVAAG